MRQSGIVGIGSDEPMSSLKADSSKDVLAMKRKQSGLLSEESDRSSKNKSIVTEEEQATMEEVGDKGLEDAASIRSEVDSVHSLHPESLAGDDARL